jgi:hypothetical protein
MWNPRHVSTVYLYAHGYCTQMNYDPVYDHKLFNRFDVPTAVVMKLYIFRDITFCSLVQVNRH